MPSVSASTLADSTRYLNSCSPSKRFPFGGPSLKRVSRTDLLAPKPDLLEDLLCFWAGAPSRSPVALLDLARRSEPICPGLEDSSPDPCGIRAVGRLKAWDLPPEEVDESVWRDWIFRIVRIVRGEAGAAKAAELRCDGGWGGLEAIVGINQLWTIA